jgi:Putative adhesin
MNIKVVLPVALAALALTACRFDVADNQFSDDHTMSQSIDRVNVADAVGDVTIEVGSGPVTVHRDVHYRDAKPGSTASLAGQTLNIASCGNNCSVDYRIRVPQGTSVTGSLSSGSLSLTGVESADVRSESGSVDFNGVRANASATTESGSVRASGVGGDLSVRTESGDVDVSGLRGTRTSAQSSSGDVTVSTESAQDVDARTASGSVTLTVADGPYRVITSSNDDKADVRLPSDPGARHILRASSDSGQVTVSGR